ncbi:hypothetical protein PHJA_002165700 [Phtheirospermum japonicum]|uniref:HMA domain-containing protein n=1 Tax=Phtheirospermum japonicum TaxID=374723 RepID=A0A830CLM4_9LAMI|nr:hypothetical protein PHJA_002165700 [Phtheirospermum japonicum]
MAEKNKKNNVDQQKKEEIDKKKKDNNNLTVVLKADLHCEGCVSKVLKCIRSYDGVEDASIGNSDGQRITVVGKVDPVKLRERLENKTHKKVEIISPPLNKDQNNNGGKDGKQEKKKNDIKDKNSKDKSDGKKPKEKELPVTTAVMKTQLHCEGCIKKIYKLVAKSKGYQDMKIDKQKELVTVTGAMDMNALAKLLKKHLKKDVEILPPKKEIEKKDNNNNSGGGEKGKAAAGGDKGKVSGGDNKKAATGSGGKAVGGEDVDKMGIGSEKVVEGNKPEFQAGYPQPMLYGSGGVVVEQFHYNPHAVGSYVHAPQIFSDENPNACSVM